VSTAPHDAVGAGADRLAETVCLPLSRALDDPAPQTALEQIRPAGGNRGREESGHGADDDTTNAACPSTDPAETIALHRWHPAAGVDSSGIQMSSNAPRSSRRDARCRGSIGSRGKGSGAGNAGESTPRGGPDDGITVCGPGGAMPA